MNKKIVFLIIILIISKLTFSQEAEKKTILTEKQNIEWVNEFKLLETNAEKLNAIKKKVFIDRVYNVFEKSCFVIVDRSSPYYKKEQILYECKITFALKIKEKYYLFDIINNPDTFKILNEVESGYIDNIEVFEGEMAYVYFGYRNCGKAIVINTDSKKLKRKIKNVL